MMKIKNPIYVLTALFLLAGCGDKVVEVEIPVPVAETREVRFVLDTEGFVSRADGDKGTLLEHERRIFNFAVLIFDSAGELEGYLAASTYDESDPGSTGVDFGESLAFRDAAGKEEALKLSVGTKHAFALVNAPAPLLRERDRLISSGSATLDDFKELVFNAGEKGGIGIITGSQEVPAGDERGFMMTSKNGPQTFYLEASEDETTINLPVGRAMAKVAVTSSMRIPRNREEQPNGVLEDIEYKVVNNPYEMYVVPRVSGGTVLTPYYYLHSGGTVDASLYFVSDANPSNGYYVALNTESEPTQLYCMENSNDVPSPYNATTAIIRGIYIPDVLYRADGTTIYNGYSKGDDFWRLREYIGGEWVFSDKYYGEAPLITDNTQRRVRYSGALTYYRIFLTDNNSPQHPHTVRRNSFYAIDITKVNNAGSNDEEDFVDGPDPEPAKNSHIEVSISLRDWTCIDQNGEI